MTPSYELSDVYHFSVYAEPETEADDDVSADGRYSLTDNISLTEMLLCINFSFTLLLTMLVLILLIKNSK